MVLVDVGDVEVDVFVVVEVFSDCFYVVVLSFEVCSFGCVCEGERGGIF